MAKRGTLVAACLAAALSSSALADQWTYEVTTDPMTSKKTAQALLAADASLDLPFPYKGDNVPVLVVRQHPQYGTDVILSIQKGQFNCSSIECSVTVRFDEKPAVRYGGTRPADHSSRAIFLDNAKRFISEATKAKRILVQPTLYQNGSPVLTFSPPQPLVWPPKN